LPRRSGLVLRQKRGEEVAELEPPEVDDSLAYLVEYLFQIGPTLGEHELSFGEMSAWCDRSGADLDDFESMALKQMSRAYLSMVHQARDPKCICPAFDAPDLDEMEPEEVEAQRATVAKGLSAWFGAVDEAHGKKRGTTKPERKT